MLCHYPLLFEKNLHTLVWGTESWEVSAVPTSPCTVANGPLRGRDIISVIDEYGPSILGDAVFEEYGGKLPLLVKFIDAKKDLSIQVHPDDRLAMERHHCFGKTEMWYIIAAEPGASILAGFKEPLTPEDYKRRVADGTIVDALARHEVHPGDVFFIPAGRVHAICGGVYLAEVQQSSDITYRLYDYNRPGLDGKPRQLHTELAADAINYLVEKDYRTYYGNTLGHAAKVIDTPFFDVRVMDLDKRSLSNGQPFRLSGKQRGFHRNLKKYHSFVISMCISGKCQITLRNDGEPIQVMGKEASLPQSVTLSAGESCLIPACCADYDIIPISLDTRILETHIDRRKKAWWRRR